MSKTKKAGIILILLGIGLPLISLVFASGYDPGFDLIENIQKMEIVIEEVKIKDIFPLIEAGSTDEEIENRLKSLGFSNKKIIEARQQIKEFKKFREVKKEIPKSLHYLDFEPYPEPSTIIREEGKAIPYKYFFASGIILVLTGIGLIVLSKEAVKK